MNGDHIGPADDRATPLRVLVVAPRPVPYERGGAERHWDGLVVQLKMAGFDAQLRAVDSPESTLSEVLDSYRRFHHLDVSGFDVVISGKYPAWMVRHDCHLRHMVHPLRGLYERYPGHLSAPSQELTAEIAARLNDSSLDDPVDGLIDWALQVIRRYPHRATFPGPFARAVVHALDQRACSGIKLHAAMSNHVARRPGYLPADTPVLITSALSDLRPGPDAHWDDANEGGYFFSYGRHTAVKRLDLTIRAFGRYRRHGGELGLRVAGDGPDHRRLRRLADLTPGVTILGHCDDDKLIWHLAGARALIATPYDEDYGLVAAEAMAWGRPVITTSDSGGVAEQVDPGTTGLIVRASEGALAKAMTLLDHEADLAGRMGRAGAVEVAARSFAPMANAVSSLAMHRDSRPKILVLSTYPAYPTTSGGARRISSIADHLAQRSEVVVAVLTNTISGDLIAPPGRTEPRIVGNGVRQILVPRSKAHLKADAQMAGLVGLPVDDIGCGLVGPATPAWSQVVDHEAADCDAIILAHPFLVDSLPVGFDRPVVYDAHNVEFDLKSQILDGRPGQARLTEWTARLEHQATQQASLVVATSPDDADRLVGLYQSSPPLIVPNGVSRPRCPTAAERLQARRWLLTQVGLRPDDPRTIAVFIGSNHPPNNDAADDLAKMARQNGDLIVVLAGTHAERQRPGAYSLGRFSNLVADHLLWGADLALNTVRYGSGTNFKLIEALAAGTPVVASTVGARGFDRPETIMTIADRDVAGAIRRTVSSKQTPTQIEQGLKVAKDYDWAKLITPLQRWLDTNLVPRP